MSSVYRRATKLLDEAASRGIAEQNARRQWLADRKSAIGASDVAAIIGVSPWASAWEVWAEKTGVIESWGGNEATRAGQAFERAVLDQAEAELGSLERDVRVKHQSLPMAATLDARVIYGGTPVEAKTTGLVGRVYGDWGDALTDQIPDYYLVQVHAQLIVTGAELAYLYALIAGRGVVKFQIDRSEKLAEQIGNLCRDWWEKHITQGIEPSRDRVPDLSVVKRLRREPSKSIALGEEFAKLIREREALKDTEKELKKSIEENESLILLGLGDAEEAWLPDGSTVSYFESSRKGYEVKPTTFRTLRIKKGK